MLTAWSSGLRNRSQPRLNLTRATLDSVIKYPWLRRSDTAKFNVYAEDLEIFDWVREGAPAQRRCFEAQIMDWADDVAIACMTWRMRSSQAPSALRTVRFGAEGRRGRNSWVAICLRHRYSGTGEAADRVRYLEFWLHDYDQSARSLGALKSMTSKLIRRFCSSAQAATRRQYGDRPLLRYRADLVVPIRTRAEVAVLKAITYVHVMRGNTDRYEWERRVISDVVEGLLRGRHPCSPPSSTPGMKVRTRSGGCASSSIRSRHSPTCRSSAGAKRWWPDTCGWVGRLSWFVCNPNDPGLGRSRLRKVRNPKPVNITCSARGHRESRNGM